MNFGVHMIIRPVGKEEENRIKDVEDLANVVNALKPHIEKSVPDIFKGREYKKAISSLEQLKTNLDTLQESKLGSSKITLASQPVIAAAVVNHYKSKPGEFTGIDADKEFVSTSLRDITAWSNDALEKLKPVQQAKREADEKAQKEKAAKLESERKAQEEKAKTERAQAKRDEEEAKKKAAEEVERANALKAEEAKRIAAKEAEEKAREKAEKEAREKAEQKARTPATEKKLSANAIRGSVIQTPSSPRSAVVGSVSARQSEVIAPPRFETKEEPKKLTEADEVQLASEMRTAIYALIKNSTGTSIQQWIATLHEGVTGDEDPELASGRKKIPDRKIPEVVTQALEHLKRFIVEDPAEEDTAKNAFWKKVFDAKDFLKEFSVEYPEGVALLRSQIATVVNATRPPSISDTPTIAGQLKEMHEILMRRDGIEKATYEDKLNKKREALAAVAERKREEKDSTQNPTKFLKDLLTYVDRNKDKIKTSVKAAATLYEFIKGIAEDKDQKVLKGGINATLECENMRTAFKPKIRHHLGINDSEIDALAKVTAVKEMENIVLQFQNAKLQHLIYLVAYISNGRPAFFEAGCQAIAAAAQKSQAQASATGQEPPTELKQRETVRASLSVAASGVTSKLTEVKQDHATFLQNLLLYVDKNIKEIKTSVKAADTLFNFITDIAEKKIRNSYNKN